MKRIMLGIISITILLLSSCVSNKEANSDIDYRQSMRDFVQVISEYSKNINPNFIIIPQNGHELLTENGDGSGSPDIDYISSIDGIGREDLFYGYSDDDIATPLSERNYMEAFMNIAVNNGIKVLVTDYCSTESFMDNSYILNEDKGFISITADSRELDNIPSYPAFPHNVNDLNITSLSEAKNFLYLLNSDLFNTKESYLNAIQDTNYDVIIIDLFYFGEFELTYNDIESLKVKSDGGTRLVISYMSIGEAEDYRYYWKEEWQNNSPSWLSAVNPNWPGNYKVKYWDKNWQSIIYGNNDSYLKKILDAGFDGVYLDIIDAYEYFEDE